MNPFERLLSSMAGVPVLRNARCRGHHALFDPQNEREPAEVAAARHEQAAWLCENACPALENCRAWFESLPVKDRPLGVVAGRVYERKSRKEAS